MKLRVKTNKRGGLSVTITVEQRNEREGKDLRDAFVDSMKKNGGAIRLGAILAELEAKGYAGYQPKPRVRK